MQRALYGQTAKPGAITTSLLIAFGAAVVGASVGRAGATVSSVTLHNFSHTIAVTAKTPGPDGKVNILQKFPGGSWGYIDEDIQVDSSGNGANWWWGVDGRQADFRSTRQTCVGHFHPDPTYPLGGYYEPDPDQGPKVALRNSPIPSGALRPGANPSQTMTFSNTRTASDGATIVETFEPGTAVSISVNSADAQFVNSGVHVSASSTMGVSIQSFTPSVITFVINTNASPLSAQSIAISGFGITVSRPVGTTVDLNFSASGSAHVYRGGTLLGGGTFTSSQVSYVAQSLPITTVSPPSAITIGAIPPIGQGALATATTAAGQVRWIKAYLSDPVESGQGTYLDLNGFGSSFSGTAIGIYDSYGNLIAIGTDNGTFPVSGLSYGQTSPVRTGFGGAPGDGRNGVLPMGTYYIGIGQSPVTFGATNWAAQGPTSGGTGTITFSYNSELSNPAHACTADFDGDGVVAVHDIFAFVTGFFGGDPRCDVDGDGVVAVADVFGFVGIWFVGCP
jgi:hypothetical protein